MNLVLEFAGTRGLPKVIRWSHKKLCEIFSKVLLVFCRKFSSRRRTLQGMVALVRNGLPALMLVDSLRCGSSAELGTVRGWD